MVTTQTQRRPRAEAPIGADFELRRRGDYVRALSSGFAQWSGPSSGNIAHMDEVRPDSLAAAVTALADHFREFGDRRAEPVAETLNGERRGLPRRVLALFSHGMGGLLDEPLYRRSPRSPGEHADVDRGATQRRDELAETVFQLARSEIS
jgi:hypothetical protein